MTTPDQPAAPVQQGATELPDSIRVPLDSLHADALYLTSRVAQGTMSAVRLSQVIRERIDAAKAALQAAPQQWQSLTDGEWVNIVNSDEVKNEGSDVHGAVCVAFKMIEKRLREKNEFSHPVPGAGQQEEDGIPESVAVCYEVYQVVGSMLSDLGQFGTAHGDKVLDNLSEARLVHKDVLPWPSFERPHPVEAVTDEQLWNLRGLLPFDATIETREDFVERVRIALAPARKGGSK